MTEPLVFHPVGSLRANYPPDWPPVEFYCDEWQITDQQLEQFRGLVQSTAGERAIDKFIQGNRAILVAALRLYSTGHHGAWVLSQQMIKPKIGQSQFGLKPDYIIGGRSSDGFRWWVVELKGANAKLFDRKGRTARFSGTLSRGICQLLSYISYCSQAQSMLRDQFRLTGFGVPRGMIFIGREQELAEDEQKQEIKAALNNATTSSFEVHTYDSLLRTFEQLHRPQHPEQP